jgi:cyclic dehypoxanthinyl futalosine synthase
VQRVRDYAAPKKAGADRWLEIMEIAHQEGMRTSVTMMYGLGETLAERVEHLTRVREVQARTGGFTAFITWPLQPRTRRRSRTCRRPTPRSTCAPWR